MVVPEKILMKKIKKREKVKKQLAATKQTKISSEDESAKEFNREYTKTCVVGSKQYKAMYIPDSPGKFVRSLDSDSNNKKRKAENENQTSSQDSKKSE